jgi:hypothetical protein
MRFSLRKTAHSLGRAGSYSCTTHEEEDTCHMRRRIPAYSLGRAGSYSSASRCAVSESAARDAIDEELVVEESYMYTYLHTHTHTHTMHIYMHTHTHTHTHADRHGHKTRTQTQTQTHDAAAWAHVPPHSPRHTYLMHRDSGSGLGPKLTAHALQKDTYI